MEQQKKLIRIGLLGFGAMGRTHTWAVQNLPFFYGALPFQARTIGVVTTTMEKSTHVAEELSLGRAYASAEELIADPDVDVIDICTPNDRHFEVLKQAILAGKHVLCEKPLCIREEEIEAILAAEKASSATLGVCFQNRFNPANRFVLDYVKDKEILSVCGQVAWHRGADYYASGAWRGKWDTEGGGVLINQAIHTLDLTALLAGMPREVMANCSNLSLKGQIEVEDTATVVGIGDVPFTFFATNASPCGMSVEITVKTRDEEIKILPHTVLIGDRVYSFPKEQRVLGKSCYGTGHIALFERFYDSIERGEHFPIDGAEGAKAVRILLAAYRSRGERVTVSHTKEI